MTLDDLTVDGLLKLPLKEQQFILAHGCYNCSRIKLKSKKELWELAQKDYCFPPFLRDFRKDIIDKFAGKKVLVFKELNWLKSQEVEYDFYDIYLFEDNCRCRWALNENYFEFGE